MQNGAQPQATEGSTHRKPYAMPQDPPTFNGISDHVPLDDTEAPISTDTASAAVSLDTMEEGHFKRFAPLDSLNETKPHAKTTRNSTSKTTNNSSDASAPRLRSGEVITAKNTMRSNSIGIVIASHRATTESPHAATAAATEAPDTQATAVSPTERDKDAARQDVFVDAHLVPDGATVSLQPVQIEPTDNPNDINAADAALPRLRSSSPEPSVASSTKSYIQFRLKLSKKWLPWIGIAIAFAIGAVAGICGTGSCSSKSLSSQQVNTPTVPGPMSPASTASTPSFNTAPSVTVAIDPSVAATLVPSNETTRPQSTNNPSMLSSHTSAPTVVAPTNASAAVPATAPTMRLPARAPRALTRPSEAPVSTAEDKAPVAAPASASSPTVANRTSAPTIFVETEVPTVAPFVVPDLQPCYRNLTDLQAIIRAKNPFTKETFKLCPNTVFDMGYINASSYCCINGQYPLHPRKDTTVQCGDDGSSGNNCTLRGGSTQLISYGPHHNYEKKSNTVYKGITFESAQDIGVLLMTDGEFLFDDCIFQNHTNMGSIKLAHYHARRELSQEVDSVGSLVERKYETWIEPTDRDLQDEEEEIEEEEIDTPPDGIRLRATFNNCLFKHNGPGPKTEQTHYGIIFAENDYIDVVINNSIFMDNAFVGSSVVGDSFAVHVVKGSTLEIHNSCFMSNDFVGRGAVLVDVAESIVAQSNNYGTNDPEVECQFINVGDASSCVEFSSTTCLATRYQSMVGGTAA